MHYRILKHRIYHIKYEFDLLSCTGCFFHITSEQQCKTNGELNRFLRNFEQDSLLKSEERYFNNTVQYLPTSVNLTVKVNPQ